MRLRTAGRRSNGAFATRARALGLTDRLLQIPFLPHWRVPEFLRSCLAVCCLEQDFPIGIHSPIVPLEVLLCGRCLVGSTEVIRKLPQWERLPHGYGCVAIEDVNDIDLLNAKLAAILHDPEPTVVVGTRGCNFARELQRDVAFPGRLERILEAAAARRPFSEPGDARFAADRARPLDDRFPLTRIAAAVIVSIDDQAVRPAAINECEQTIDLARARAILAAIERAIAKGRTDLGSFAQAVKVEIAIAVAQAECEDAIDGADPDPLFRLDCRRWAIAENELGGLMPIRAANIRVLLFDYDVAEFRGATSVDDFPPAASPHASALVVFGRTAGARRDPLLIDSRTADIIELSDGTRTAAEIIRHLNPQAAGRVVEDELRWIEKLFLDGLLRLQAARVNAPTRQISV